MALKDDIAAEVVDRLRADYTRIADAVLDRDGKIGNTFTGNPVNKEVAIKTALEYLGARSRGMEVQQDAMDKKIDALTKAVAALAGKVQS